MLNYHGKTYVHAARRRCTVLKKVGVITMFICAMTNAAYCCTVFTASVGDTVLFGNNEDAPERDSYAWFYPATETEHGGVYFGFGGYYVQGGMNDQGLCFDITTVPELKMRPHPEKSSTLNFGRRALERCATVEEVIQLVDQYNLSHMGMAQFLFADKTGDSVIVCPGVDGEMKTIRKEGVYQVITNFNVTYPQLGGYPCWRHKTVVEKLEKIESEEDITVGRFATILKAVQQGTAYSTIYDLPKGIVCLFNQQNFSEVVVFKLKEELEKGYHSYFIPSLFTREVKFAEKPKSGGSTLSEELSEGREQAEVKGSEMTGLDTQPRAPSHPVTVPSSFPLLGAISIIALILVGVTLIHKRKSKR